ncbi:hypothetical protein HPC49_29110 [Pyxidicoccus fallax]|uniref:Immunity MXAN-0049 protein domain-containing protein n=1 Tax=Pyxidicoccus fallax TaxID=394095 RepID=A0A848LD06_9BACT|nr:DUF1629 domain-containing protein [Pyxidicoccus fallax]NMO16314.1 hypothetical protein [Pyxidicoccus fallax]NPC82265.1 hypothetical protein [Pyxidicoccus fallax]
MSRSSRYFALRQDVYVPGRWYLDEPVDSEGKELEDIWQFTEGHPVQVEQPLYVPCHRAGRSLDFSTTSVGATPILHPKVATVFEAFAPDDLQVLPVRVEGQAEQYFLLNVTRLVKCIDDSASEEVQYWRPEDGRPEKTGRYRSVLGLRIDKARVGDARVFRTWGWTVALIVAEELKVALERTGATGMSFTEV